MNESLRKNTEYAHVFAILCPVMTSNSHSKRKRVVISIEDKLTVCDLVRKKVPCSETMNRFHIGKSTICDIARDEEKLKVKTIEI